MTFQSVNFNGAKIELAALESRGPDALQGLQAQISGAVVAQYDTQLADFSAELTAVNAAKNAIQSDKTAITAMMTTPTELVAKDGYVTRGRDSENKETTSAFAGSAVIMDKKQYDDFVKLAQKNGIDLSGVATNGKKNAVPESILQATKDALDGKLADLNASSEIKLIHYQALMDARKQAMMMLSNMISSDNQVRLAVIQNMKG